MHPLMHGSFMAYYTTHMALSREAYRGTGRLRMGSPQVGKAWKYLKELRMDRGPLEHDEAVDELQKWWNAQQ